MVPGEMLEDIFAYLSRDALDYCEITCLTWNKIIEMSKRLTQRRIVNLNYNRDYSDDDPNNRFFIKLKSSTGKTIRIEDCQNQQELPAFRVFKNIIIRELNEYDTSCDIDFLEKIWAKIFKLAGGRINVKKVFLPYDEEILKDNIKLKRFHDLLQRYFDAEALTTDIANEFLLYREAWRHLDLETKTVLDLRGLECCFQEDFPIDTFKEFISGRYLENTKLNELRIVVRPLILGYLHKIDRNYIFPLIVEAFCNTVEPQKFFKCIKFCQEENDYITYTYESYDEIFRAFGFVCEDLDPQKYLLPHPKLNWALEAKQRYTLFAPDDTDNTYTKYNCEYESDIDYDSRDIDVVIKTVFKG